MLKPNPDKRRSRPALLMPLDLPKPAMPVTIVTGSPGSGKTTYVAMNKGPEDEVIDLGEIHAELSGSAMHEPNPKDLWRALEERNHRLARGTHGLVCFMPTGSLWLPRHYLRLSVRSALTHSALIVCNITHVLPRIGGDDTSHVKVTR
jgi:hypothetical protein